MGAVAGLRQTLATLLEDLAPGRVLFYEPSDNLNGRSIFIGRPSLTAKPVAGAIYQVSQPIVFVADGVDRSAQDWLDDTVEAAWDVLTTAGYQPASSAPADITLPARSVDGSPVPACGAVLTINALARSAPAEESP